MLFMVAAYDSHEDFNITKTDFTVVILHVPSVQNWFWLNVCIYKGDKQPKNTDIFLKKP